METHESRRVGELCSCCPGLCYTSRAAAYRLEGRVRSLRSRIRPVSSTGCLIPGKNKGFPGLCWAWALRVCLAVAELLSGSAAHNRKNCGDSICLLPCRKPGRVAASVTTSSIEVQSTTRTCWKQQSKSLVAGSNCQQNMVAINHGKHYSQSLSLEARAISRMVTSTKHQTWIFNTHFCPSPRQMDVSSTERVVS
jgi:hypothetical protein